MVDDRIEKLRELKRMVEEERANMATDWSRLQQLMDKRVKATEDLVSDGKTDD